MNRRTAACELRVIAGLLLGFHAEQEADKVYEQSLDDGCWQAAYKAYPDSNGSEATPAARHIIKCMKDKYGGDYSDTEWFLIEGELRSKVHAGLT